MSEFPVFKNSPSEINYRVYSARRVIERTVIRPPAIPSVYIDNRRPVSEKKFLRTPESSRGKGDRITSHGILLDRVASSLRKLEKGAKSEATTVKASRDKTSKLHANDRPMKLSISNDSPMKLSISNDRPMKLSISASLAMAKV